MILKTQSISRYWYHCDKLIILIDTSIIRMTVDNLNFLRDNYPDKKFHFIRRNLDEYVDMMSKDLFLQVCRYDV